MHTRSPGSISQIPDLESEPALHPLSSLQAPPGRLIVKEEEDPHHPRGAWSIPSRHHDEKSILSSTETSFDATDSAERNLSRSQRLEADVDREKYADDSRKSSTSSTADSVPPPRLMGYRNEALRLSTAMRPESAFSAVLRPEPSSSSMPNSAGLAFESPRTYYHQRLDHDQQDESHHEQRRQFGEASSPYQAGHQVVRDSPLRYASRSHGPAPYPSATSPRYASRHLASHQVSSGSAQPVFGFPQYPPDAGPSSLPDRLGQPMLDHPQYYPRGSEHQGVNTSGVSVFGHPEYTSVIPSSSRKRITGKSNTPAACSACKKAHLACDTARPCKRCIGIGRPEGCIDVPHKKRGRPKLVTTSRNLSTGVTPTPSSNRSPYQASEAFLPRGSSYEAEPLYLPADSRSRDTHEGFLRRQSQAIHSPYEHARTRRISDDPRHRRIAQDKGLGVSLTEPEGCPRVTGSLDLEAVVTIRNDLLLTGIIPFNGNTLTFGDRGTVLDKQCVNYPFLDFIHPDDRDKVRDAVFCALVTRGQLENARQRERERLHASTGQPPEDHDVVVDPSTIEGVSASRPIMPIAINTEEEMVTYLSQDEQHRGIAIVRLKDLSGEYSTYQIVARNDPKQWFMAGKNDLVIGLERVSKRPGSASTPSHISTPRSVHELIGSLSEASSIPSLSPTGSKQLPSFSELASRVHDPYPWNAPGSQVPPPFPMGRAGPQSPAEGSGTPYELQHLSISAPAYTPSQDRISTLPPTGTSPQAAEGAKTRGGSRQDQTGYFTHTPH